MNEPHRSLYWYGIKKVSGGIMAIRNRFSLRVFMDKQGTICVV